MEPTDEFRELRRMITELTGGLNVESQLDDLDNTIAGIRLVVEEKTREFRLVEKENQDKFAIYVLESLTRDLSAASGFVESLADLLDSTRLNLIDAELMLSGK